MESNVYKALGHPLRRQIMTELRGGPKSSGTIAEAFDVAWPTVTRHLNVLKEADLITAERHGTTILYRINSSVLEDTIGALMTLLNTDNGDDDIKEAAE